MGLIDSIMIPVPGDKQSGLSGSCIESVETYKTDLPNILFIVFIVCAFASIFKGCKYTNLYVAGYFVLLALTTISFLPNITTKEFMMFYTLNSWSMVLGYISFMILFLGGKKEEKKPEENKEETKEIAE